MDKTILAKDIKKNFYINNQIIPVLKGIDLEISPGEIIAVCGPSGVGKTTLLYLLGLMDKLSSGYLKIMGIDVKDIDEKKTSEIRNKHIGFLFQFHYLLADFTVFENIYIPTQIIPNNNNIEEKIEYLLNKLGIQNLKNRFPKELSGGEQQRVALARALINFPEIILADEPTGNLDSENSNTVIELLFNQARQNNISVIIATHNLELAKKTDKIYFLKDGKIEKILTCGG